MQYLISCIKLSLVYKVIRKCELVPGLKQQVIQTWRRGVKAPHTFLIGTLDCMSGQVYAPATLSTGKESFVPIM